MRKLARVGIGAALLLSTGVSEVVAAAPPSDPQVDSLAVVAMRDQRDQEMGQLPDVFVSTPPTEGVLGVQAYRDNLPEQVRLDMLSAVGQRVDMDRGQSQAPHS